MPTQYMEMLSNCDKLVHRIFVAMNDCDVRMLNETLEEFSPQQVEFLEEIAKLAKNFHK